MWVMCQADVLFGYMQVWRSSSFLSPHWIYGVLCQFETFCSFDSFLCTNGAMNPQHWFFLNGPIAPFVPPLIFFFLFLCLCVKLVVCVAPQEMQSQWFCVKRSDKITIGQSLHNITFFVVCFLHNDSRFNLSNDLCKVYFELYSGGEHLINANPFGTKRVSICGVCSSSPLPTDHHSTCLSYKLQSFWGGNWYDLEFNLQHNCILCRAEFLRVLHKFCTQKFRRSLSLDLRVEPFNCFLGTPLKTLTDLIPRWFNYCPSASSYAIPAYSKLTSTFTVNCWNSPSRGLLLLLLFIVIF